MASADFRRRAVWGLSESCWKSKGTKLVEHQQPVPGSEIPWADEAEVVPDMPRLSIIELMVLTAAMAITIAFQEMRGRMNMCSLNRMARRRFEVLTESSEFGNLVVPI